MLCREILVLPLKLASLDSCVGRSTRDSEQATEPFEEVGQ